MSNLTIYFIRHAQSEANINGSNHIHGPNTKVPLTDMGTKQAKRLGSHFKNIEIIPDVVFSSPALRAQQTADIVLTKTGFTGWVIIEDDVVEARNGDWAGKPRSFYSTVKAEDQWKLIPGDEHLGESPKQVAGRMVDVLYRIIYHYSTYPCIKTIFIFSHSRAIKYMLTKLYNLQHSFSANEMKIDNSSVTTIEVQNGKIIDNLAPYSGQSGVDILVRENGKLVYSTALWNDTSHLD